MKTFSVGDIVKIIRMNDLGVDIEASTYVGQTGVIEYIDSMGQLHGTWGSLAIIPCLDTIDIIGNVNN